MSIKNNATENRINKLNKRLLKAREILGVNSNTYQAIANAILTANIEFMKHGVTDDMGNPIEMIYYDKNGNVQMSRSSLVAGQAFIGQILDIVEEQGTTSRETEALRKDLIRTGIDDTPDNIVKLLWANKTREEFYDRVWAAMYDLKGIHNDVRQFLDRVTGVSGNPEMNTQEALIYYHKYYNDIDFTRIGSAREEDKRGMMIAKNNRKRIRNEMIKYMNNGQPIPRNLMKEYLAWGDYSVLNSFVAPGRTLTDTEFDEYMNTMQGPLW